MESVVNPPRVIKFEELLNSKSIETQDENKTQDNSRESESLPNQVSIPKGRPKSGKFWKTSKERASSMVKSRGLRDTWQKKEKLRQDLKRVKEKCRKLKQELLDAKEAKKERRRENLKRQEENRKRSEIVQVVKNVNKLKRMKKKHLRSIEKRDTTEVKK